MRGTPIGLPVAVSQIRAEPSALPVITALPSGRNATSERGLMRQGPAEEGTAGGGVPDSRRAVGADGQHGLAHRGYTPWR